MPIIQSPLLPNQIHPFQQFLFVVWQLPYHGDRILGEIDERHNLWGMLH